MPKYSNAVPRAVSTQAAPPFFISDGTSPMGFQIPPKGFLEQTGNQVDKPPMVVDGFKLRGKATMDDKNSEKYGVKESMEEVETLLAPHFKNYPELWPAPDAITYKLNLSGNTQFFENLQNISFCHSNLAIVPQLERSLTSQTVLDAFVEKENFCLASLDNLPLSLSLSKFLQEIKRRIEDKLTLKYQAELDDYKTQLEACRGKLVRNKDTSLAVSARQSKAQEFLEDILPIVQKVEEEGADTLQAIADRLNELGHRTRTGANWSPTGIFRLKEKSQHFPKSLI